MPDEPTQTSNSEPSSIPIGPQDPTLDAPILSTPSEQPTTAPQAPQSPREADSAVQVKDANYVNEPLDEETLEEDKDISDEPNVTIEKKPDGVTITEVMEPPEPPTAHFLPPEPLEVQEAP